MKEFFKYYFDRPLRDDGKGKMWWTVNYNWTFGSLLFIGIFIEGAVRYKSTLIWTAVSFPVILLIYNLVDEYYAFQYFKLPDYLKPLKGELDENLKGTNAYWDRVRKFEDEQIQNGNMTTHVNRHNEVIGRKVSARTLQNITKYLCSAILLYMIIRTFITG